ncbi:MAG: hypothetical protein J6Q82_02090 [Clostridia bacterium]|nr:hypothetical protein [Clostridia bacterium]
MKKSLLVFFSLLLIASMLLSACNSDDVASDETEGTTTETPSADNGNGGKNNSSSDNSENTPPHPDDQNHNENIDDSNTPTISTELKTCDIYNLRFAYPAHWEEDFYGMLFWPADNPELVLEVTSGVKTDYYSTMTEESFREALLRAMEKLEISVPISNVSVETTVNDHGLTITVIDCTIIRDGSESRMVLFATTIDQTTHLIQLSHNPDQLEDLIEPIFHSMEAIDGENYEGEDNWNII